MHLNMIPLGAHLLLMATVQSRVVPALLCPTAAARMGLDLHVAGRQHPTELGLLSPPPVATCCLD